MNQETVKDTFGQSLQDKAYDLLGDMLVERNTAKYMKELEEDEANGRSAEMEAFFARQDQTNMKKIQVYSRKQRNRRFLFHTLPRIAQVAAVIIAVMALAGGMALATSKTVRVQVMRLLVNIEEDYTELSLIEDEEALFDVPAEWQGSSFPSYIPEGMQMEQILSMPDYHLVEYRLATTGQICIRFSEAGEGASTNIDSEDANVTTVMIRGEMGYMAQEDGNVRIFWSDGQFYYILIMQNATSDEALRVAESVRKIN